MKNEFEPSFIKGLYLVLKKLVSIPVIKYWSIIIILLLFKFALTKVKNCYKTFVTIETIQNYFLKCIIYVYKINTN